MVMVIISILLMLAMPVFSKVYADTKLKTSAQELTATLRYAYQSALSQGLRYKINFQQSGGEYWLEKEQNYAFVEIRNSLIKPILLPAGISFKRITGSSGLFYPNGTADNLTVYLQNEHSNIYTVQFNGLTGQIRVFDYEKE